MVDLYMSVVPLRSAYSTAFNDRNKHKHVLERETEFYHVTVVKPLVSDYNRKEVSASLQTIFKTNNIVSILLAISIFENLTALQYIYRLCNIYRLMYIH